MSSAVLGFGLLLLLIMGLTRPVQAASLFWDNTGATAGTTASPTGIWGTDSFWSTDSTGASATAATLTTSADTLTFAAGTTATGAYTVTLNGAQAAKLLTLEDGTATFTGGTLNLGGGGGITLATSTVTGATMQANLGITGDQTFNIGSGRTLALTTGTFTRNAGATANVQGSGTLTSTQTNLSANNAAGIIGAWASFGTGTSTKYATFTGSTVGGLTGTAAATGTDLTDTSGLVNYDLAAGGGTVPATVSANTIRYTGGIGTTAPGATSFSVNGLMNAGTGVWTLGTNALTIGADRDLVVNAANADLVLSGIVQNNGGGASVLTKTGAGNLTLSGVNTYSGGTFINAGTFTFGSASTNTGSTVTGGATGTGNVTLADGVIIGNTASANTWYLPQLTLLGTTTLTSGNRLTVSANTLDLAGGTRVINVNSKSLTIATSGGTSTTPANSSGSSNVETTGLASWEFTNTLGSLTVQNGTLALENTNFTGGNGGTYGAVRFTNSNSVNFTGNGALIVGANVVLLNTNAFVAANAPQLTIATGGYVDALDADATVFSLAGGGTYALSLVTTTVSPKTLTINGTTGSATFSGVFQDGPGVGASLAVTKTGGGTQILSGANTHTGTTTMSTGGVLNIQNDTALGSTSGGTIVAAGSALQLQNNITVGAEALTLSGTGVANDGGLRNISGTNTFGGLLTLVSAARINSDAGTLTLSNVGTITGAGFGLTVGGAGNTTIASSLGTTSGTLTKDGSGRLTLTGANTFTGGTTLTAGTLALNSTTALGTSGTFTINGGTLDNTSGAALTLVNNHPLTVGGDFAAFGSGSTNTSNLNLGTGAASLAMSANTAGLANKTVTLNGTGTSLTLGGTVTAITTANTNGTLNVNGAGNTLNLGSLNLSTNSGNARVLTVGGSGNVTVNGLLTSASLTSSLTYAGSGTLTLGGSTQSSVTATTATGFSAFSGTFKLDESAMASTQNLLLTTGTFALRGGGLTIFGGNQTFATINAVNSGSTITLDKGVGAGANLTATTFTRTTGHTLLVDRANAGTGAFTASNFVSASNLVGWAVVYDGTSYKFATNSASGVFAATAESTSTALPTSGATNATSYTVSANTTLSANSAGRSLTINGAGSTLNLGANTLTLGSVTAAPALTTTAGILVTGAGANVIQNGTLAGVSTNYEIDLHNYGSGGLTLNTGINTGTLPFAISGTGNTTLGGAFNGTGLFSIGGTGTTTLSSGFTLANNNALTLTGGASLDLGGQSISTTGIVTHTSTSASGITNSGAAATLTMGNNSQAGVNSSFSGNLNLVLNAAASTSHFSSTFNNTGNLTLNANGAGLIFVGGSPIATSGSIGFGTINNTGTITNSGTSTGAVSLGSNLGGNVTAVNQASTTSALTLSGTNTAYRGITTLAAGTTLNLASATALGGNGSTTGTGGALVLGGTNTLDNTSGAALVLTTANALALNGDITFTGTNNLTFGSGAVTLANGTRTLTTTANTLTFNGAFGDGGNALGLTKAGSGTLTLAGLNTYTGATTVTGGGTLAFAPTAGGTQTLGSLVLAGRGATLRSTFAGSSSIVVFTSLTARTVGNTGLFIASGGTNGTTNKIVLTGQATGLLDQGTFFGTSTGTDYAFYDATGFVRGINYGVDAGSTTAAGGSSLTGTNVQTTGAVTAQTTATFTTLKLSGNTNVTLAAGQTLTTSGLLKAGNVAGGATLSGGTGVQAASNGELVIRTDGASDALTISTPILANGSNALTKSGAGTLTLSGANTYTGATSVNGGTLAIGAGGSLNAGSAVTLHSGTTLTNSGTISGSTTVNSGASATLAGGSSTGAVTLTGGNLTLTGSTALGVGTISGTGTETIAVNNTFASGNTLNFANGSSFLSITPGVNAVFTLANGGGTTAFTNFLQFDNAGAGSGATTTVDGGTWNVASMGSNVGSVRFGGTLNLINGAVLNTTSARFAAHGTTTIGGTGTGSMNIGAGQWSSESSALAFTYNVLNGGTLTAASSFILTLNQAPLVSARANSINISSGGLMSTTGALTIGGTVAITTGSETNTLTLSSGGKLLVNNNFSFNPTLAGATNTFNWAGQLSAATITTANMPSATLTNAGGTLAPGDIGTAGRTTITGNYTQTSAGTLAVDIGGTTQGSAFQTGQYDFVSVSGNTALDGRLSFSLINAFTPANDTTTLHTVLTGLTPASSGVTGSFANAVTASGGNTRVVGADGLSSFLVAINNTAATATTGGLTNVAARSVALGGYQATNTYSGTGTAWDTASAGAWTAFDPGATATPASQASGAIAQFADGTVSTGAISVSLNSTRNLQGLQFASAAGARAYTLTQGGSGALIFDNTANAAAATLSDTSTSGTANTVNVPITLASNLTATVSNAANTLTLAGAIGEASVGKTLTKAGAGTLVLSGTNTYTGLTTVNVGTLAIGSAGSLASGNALILGASGLATFANAGQTLGAISNANTTTNALNFTASTGTVTLASLSGAGNTTFGSNGTVTGGISEGTVTSVGNLTANISGGTIAAGGLLTGNISSGTVGAGSLSASTVSGGTNTITGAAGITTLSNGTTTVGGVATIGTLSGGTVNLNGATSAITTLSGGTVNLGSGTDLSVSAGTSAGLITGAGGSLTKSGAGTLTLTSANSYTGATTVSAGVLNIQNASALGTTAGGTSVSSGAALQLQGGITVGTEALTLSGTGVASDGALRNISGTNTYGGLVTLGASSRINSDAGTLTLSNAGTITGAGFDLTLGGAGNMTVTSIIGTGSGNLIKDGAGTVTLSGANTFTGTTTINAGTLRLGVINALDSTSAIILANAAGVVLDLNGFNVTFGSLSGGGNLGGSVSLGSTTLTTGEDNSSTTYASNFSGGGGITKTGTGVFTLTGTNSYTGATTVNGGTLQAGSTTAFGNGSAVTLANTSGVLLDLNNNAISVGSLAGGGATGGNVNLGFATLTAGGDDTSTSFGGVISGTGGLTKSGSGTLTLNAANTYTGLTTVNAGTLAVGSSGSLASGNALTLGASGLATFANVGQTLGAVSNANSATNALNFTASTGTVTLVSLSGVGNTRFGSSGTVTGGIASGTVNAVGNLTASISGGTTTVGGVATIGTLSGGIANLNGSTSAITTLTGGTVNLGASTALTVSDGTTSDAITGTGGSLTKISSGSLTLNSANTYTGLTTVNAGTLSIGSGGSLFSGNALTLGASGAAEFANAGQTLGAVDNANTTANALNFNAATGTVTLASLSGAGNTRFGSDGIVTGGISAGTVNAVGNLSASISGGTTTVAGVATIGTLSGGTANLNGATSAITTFNGGTVNLSSSTSLSVSGGTSAGVITGTGGSLNKIGSGTLTLTGTNTYTGATTVSTGALTLHAASGAALANTTAVVVANGATISIGAADQINASASLTLNGGSVAVNGFNQTLGTLDLNASSALNLSGSAALVFADSSGLDWDSATLSVSNFSTTTNSLRFGSSSGGLTATQLGLFRFVEFGNSTAVIDANGFLAPVSTDFLNTGGSDIVIASTITGTTTVTQSGTGSTTLTAPSSTLNTSSGLASVTAGTLIIGTAAGGNWAGDVLVAGLGIFKGRGDVTGFIVVNSGGTYSPGKSPAIQHVGSLTVNSGGFVTIELDGPTAGTGSGFHDQIASAGAVSLNGGTLSGSTVFTGSSGYLPTFGASHTIITGSAVTGTFTAYDFASANLPAGVTFLPEYTATAVNLYAVPTNYASAVVGLNANQTQVGTALQSLRLSRPQFELDQRTSLDARSVVFNGLKTKDAAGLRTAYDQLTPEKLTALAASTFQSASILTSSLQQRSVEIRRFGPASVSLNGVARPAAAEDYSVETVIEDGVHYQIATAKPQKRAGFFASATGAFAAVDSSNERFGSFSQTGAATAGIDYALSEHQTVGLVVSQALADTDFSSNSGSARTTTNRVGVFHDYQKNGFFVNASVSGGFSSYDSKREIAFLNQTASGATQGLSYGGQLTTGYDFKVGEFIMGPTASVAYDHAQIDGFDETGSAADLMVERQNADSLITKLGVHVSRPFVAKKIGWIPDVSLSVSRQSFNPNRITARLAAGGDAFRVSPQAAGSEYINPGASLSALLPNGWTMRLSYDAILNPQFAEHRVNLSVGAGF